MITFRSIIGRTVSFSTSSAFKGHGRSEKPIVDEYMVFVRIGYSLALRGTKEAGDDETPCSISIQGKGTRERK